MAYTSSQVVQAVPTGINSALVFIKTTVHCKLLQQIFTNCFSATMTYRSFIV
jgi:hypothetical protein